MSVSQRHLVRSWLQVMSGLPLDDINVSAPDLQPGDTCLVFRITPVDRSTNKVFFNQPVVEVRAIARATSGTPPTGRTEALCQRILDFVDDFPVTLDIEIDSVLVDCAQPRIEAAPVESSSGEWAEHRFSLSLPYQV